MTPAELLAARRQREDWITECASEAAGCSLNSKVLRTDSGETIAVNEALLWIISRHAQPLLDAYERLLLDMELILQDCRRCCDSGTNPSAHALALKILNRMGERPIKEASK